MAASSWLLNVPAQQAFDDDGILVPPTVRQWQFEGPNVTFNTVTGRIEISAPAVNEEQTILATQVFS